MKRKYNLKSQVNSPLFQRMTGIETFEVLGQKNCEIVKQAAKATIPIQRYAYGVFNDNKEYGANSSIKVNPTCGVLNCVKKDHLKAIYKPTKKDAQYIKDYMAIDGIDHLSHVLKVPVSLLQELSEYLIR